VKKHRARDIALEVLIGVAIVAAIISYAEFGPVRWMPALKWWGLLAETGVLFGYVGRAMRAYWGRGRFWAGLLGFVTAHLATWVAVQLRVERFGLLWFVFIGYAEWLGLAYLLALLLEEHVEPESSRRHRAP
jgi:hypothetical protein